MYNNSPTKAPISKSPLSSSEIVLQPIYVYVICFYLAFFLSYAYTYVRTKRIGTCMQTHTY